MRLCATDGASEVLHTPSTHLDLTNSVQIIWGIDLWVCLREPRPMRHHGPDRDTGQGFRDLNCFLSLLAFPLGPPCRARLVLVLFSSRQARENDFGRCSVTSLGTVFWNFQEQ